MKPNVLIAGCLALLILCTCAVAGAQAAELYAEPDAELGEWDDLEVTPTAAVNLTVAEETESAVESCAEPDAVLDECDDPEVTPTVAVDPTVAEEIESGSTLMTEYTAATAGSLQPLFKAPWEGQKRITQGTNNKGGSHSDHINPKTKAPWDNTYALDIGGIFDVLAPYDGTVCLADKEGTKFPSSGKVVVIEHAFEGRKYYTVYLHLSEIYVDNGIELKQGQVFAKSGNTGSSSEGAHLHFHLFANRGGSENSHTQPIQRLVLKRPGVDNDFRVYNMSNGDLDNNIVKNEIFESNNIPVSKETVKTRDTVLVLDASGSMDGTPVTVLKEAAKIFCSEVLNASGNQVAIVVYSSTVERTLDFTSDLDSLNSTIDSIWAYGGTNIGAALDSASSMLSSSDADAKNIVLMTDGLPQSGFYKESGRYSSSDISTYYRYANYVYEQCSELKQSYNIYTLGFFHGLYGKELQFGHKFLNDIQNKGYYEVTDASKLKFIFGELAEDITKEDYPIIVVHGMMGGKLYDGNDLVWFDPDKLPADIRDKLLDLDNLGNLGLWEKWNLKNKLNKLDLGLGRLDINTELEIHENGVNLNTPKVEKEYGVLDFYEELVDDLCEQFPDRAVYFYSYDWRKSNSDSAAKLNNLINDVKTQTGYSKVDLVCHSMGGLVASSYVNSYAANDVRYIITLATPYEGSPSAIMIPLHLLSGEVEEVAANQGLTKDLIVGLPSVSETAPTERYFKSTGFLKTGEYKKKGLFGKELISEDITYEEYCDTMRSMFGNNYESAVIFQNSIKDTLLDLDNTYFAVAAGKPTEGEIIINKEKSLKKLEVLYFIPTVGDGTVPYRSATMDGLLLEYKDENEKDPSGNPRYIEFDVDHTEILSHEDALDWIKSILSQTTYPHKGDEINYPGYMVIRIACPIDVTIDVNGEILSSDPEVGSIYVPNGRLDFIGNNGVLICLEDTGTAYDINIVGTGEGTMDYDIRWYDADNTLTETRSLYEVPITADTKIATNTDNTGPTVLNIDSDGDGTFDTQWSVDASGELVVADLKPAYTSYSDGGSDTTSFAITSGSVSFWRSAGITGINFRDGVTGMVILNDPSPEITPPENTYAIFDISAPSFEGSAEINFVIPSAILAGSGYSKTDVVMKHYTNDTWQNLPTYFIGEELGAVSYMATTTNFAPFAIVYETGWATVAGTGGSQKASASDETAMTPTVDETQPVGEETAATGEEPTVSPSEGTTAETEATATKSPAPLVGMLIGLGAAALLRRRT